MVAEQLNDECISEYHPDRIMSHLGLSLSSLKGTSLLDLGCGIKAGFVGYLRNNGVNAWGVDQLLDESNPPPYTARAEAFDIPDFGPQFDIATAHFSVFRWGNNYFFDQGIKRKVLDQETYEKHLTGMGLTVQRLKSRLKPGGKLIIFPYPNDLLPLIREYNITIEDIPEENATTLLPADIGVDFNVYPELKQRMIITMPE